MGDCDRLRPSQNSLVWRLAPNIWTRRISGIRRKWILAPTAFFAIKVRGTNWILHPPTHLLRALFSKPAHTTNAHLEGVHRTKVAPLRERDPNIQINPLLLPPQRLLPLKPHRAPLFLRLLKLRPLRFLLLLPHPCTTRLTPTQRKSHLRILPNILTSPLLTSTHHFILSLAIHRLCPSLHSRS
jgi:hypothetical protein